MTKGHSLSRGILQMRVVHSHLREVSVGRTSEGVWEDEV